MNKTNPDSRRRDLAMIHIAAKQLFGNDIDLYRDTLFAVAQVRSAGDLDFSGRQKVLAHLRKLGWHPNLSFGSKKPSAKQPKRPTPSADKLPMIKRIRAQLISLNRKPDRYADGLAMQMFQVDYFEWCTADQLHKLSAALSYQQVREAKKCVQG